MLEPIKNFGKESSPLRTFALTTIILFALIIITTVWCYVRLETHRSGAPVEEVK